MIAFLRRFGTRITTVGSFFIRPDPTLEFWGCHYLLLRKLLRNVPNSLRKLRVVLQEFSEVMNVVKFESGAVVPVLIP